MSDKPSSSQPLAAERSDPAPSTAGQGGGLFQRSRANRLPPNGFRANRNLRSNPNLREKLSNALPGKSINPSVAHNGQLSDHQPDQPQGVKRDSGKATVDINLDTGDPRQAENSHQATRSVFVQHGLSATVSVKVDDSSSDDGGDDKSNETSRRPKKPLTIKTESSTGKKDRSPVMSPPPKPLATSSKEKLNQLTQAELLSEPTGALRLGQEENSSVPTPASSLAPVSINKVIVLKRYQKSGAETTKRVPIMVLKRSSSDTGKKSKSGSRESLKAESRPSSAAGQPLTKVEPEPSQPMESQQAKPETPMVMNINVHVDRSGSTRRRSRRNTDESNDANLTDLNNVSHHTHKSEAAAQTSDNEGHEIKLQVPQYRPEKHRSISPRPTLGVHRLTPGPEYVDPSSGAHLQVLSPRGSRSNLAVPGPGLDTSRRSASPKTVLITGITDHENAQAAKIGISLNEEMQKDQVILESLLDDDPPDSSKMQPRWADRADRKMRSDLRATSQPQYRVRDFNQYEIGVADKPTSYWTRDYANHRSSQPDLAHRHPSSRSTPVPRQSRNFTEDIPSSRVPDYYHQTGPQNLSSAREPSYQTIEADTQRWAYSSGQANVANETRTADAEDCVNEEGIEPRAVMYPSPALNGAYRPYLDRYRRQVRYSDAPIISEPLVPNSTIQRKLSAKAPANDRVLYSTNVRQMYIQDAAPSMVRPTPMRPAAADGSSYELRSELLLDNSRDMRFVPLGGSRSDLHFRPPSSVTIAMRSSSVTPERCVACNAQVPHATTRVTPAPTATARESPIAAIIERYRRERGEIARASSNIVRSESAKLLHPDNKPSILKSRSNFNLAAAAAAANSHTLVPERSRAPYRNPHPHAVKDWVRREEQLLNEIERSFTS